MTTLDPYSSRNTIFVARVKNAAAKSPERSAQARFSPKSRKSFNENASYACIANPKNNSIYISESTFSGKLLNSQNPSKDNLSNRYLFPDSCENYPFDKVFNENCEQRDFYQETTKPLLNYALSGINSLVVTYGACRSGKSFTMHGDESGDIGILPRFIRDLLGITENSGFGVHVSIMQIYRDWIIDLLKDVKELARSLAGDPENAEFTKTKVRNTKDFIQILEEAYYKRELYSKAKEIKLKKFHFIIRITLVNEREPSNPVFSQINFVELAESSFLANEAKYKPNELEWLNSSFNSLFDILVKYHSKLTKKMAIQNNPFNKYLEQTFNQKSKLLFICCLSPSPKDITKSREALQFASNLRSLILQKGEKVLSKLIKSIQEQEQKSISKSSLGDSESTPVSPTLVIDRKLKSIKSKINNASVLSVTGDDFDEWIRDREYELLKAENEISILPSNAERHSVKLQELAQLRTEIESLKEKQKRARTSASMSKDARKSNRSDTAPKTRPSENILILRNDTSQSRLNTKGESPKQQPSVRSNQSKKSSQPKITPVTNKSKKNTPRQSRSQSISPYPSFREGSVESSRKTSNGRVSSPSLRKSYQKLDTPKFEQNNRQSLSRSVSQERGGTVNSRSYVETSSYLTAPVQDNSRLSKSPVRGGTRSPATKSPARSPGTRSPGTPGTPKSRKRTLSPSPYGKKGGYSSGEDSAVKKLRKSKSEKSSNFSGKKDGRSRSKPRGDKVTKLLEKCEELKSVKDRNFDFVDEEEEHFVRKKLNDCTRDKVINKYRELFYKAREMKELLTEIAETSYKMGSVTSKLKDQNDYLFEENTTLRKKLESAQGDMSDREKHTEKSLKNLKDKVYAVEQERDFLVSKVAELQNEIQQLRPLATRGSERVSFLSTIEQHQSLQQGSHNQANLILESRIQELENSLLERDHAIRDYEEQRLRENYQSKDLKSELELQKKKLLISQEEVRDIEKQNFELRSKNDSNSDVISALNDQIQDLQLQLKLKTDEAENEKRRVKDFRERVRDLEAKNSDLQYQTDKVGLEGKARDRLQQQVMDIKEELKVLRKINDKSQDEIMVLTRKNQASEEENKRKILVIDDLKKKVQHLNESERKVDKFAEKTQQLKNMRDTLKDENEKLKLESRKDEQIKRDQETKLLQFRMENERLVKDRDDLEKRVNELREEGKLTRDELSHAVEQLNKISNQAEKNEKDKENYKTQLVVLRHDYSQLQDKFKDFEDGLKHEMSQEVSRLHQENEKFMSNQNKLKVISDIQSLIRSHRKTNQILHSPSHEE